jgi:SAM-dependent methyltransferase
MVGERRLEKRPEQPRPNAKIPTVDPLLERIVTAGHKLERPSDRLFADGEVSVDRLFSIVDSFEQQRRKYFEALQEVQAAIREIYDSFSAEQRAEFFARLYDRFAERYDSHMRETGHYAAIERLLQYSFPFLNAPVIDLTAGTGEPLRNMLYLLLQDYNKVLRNRVACWVHANEISSKMLEKAKEKLGAYQKINFTGFDAYELPEDLCGKFRTALCSQTFHLIADKDKTRLVKSIHNALEPGGIAVIIEEDPFMVSPTQHIEGVSIFINSIASPIKHRGTLIAFFENNDFDRLEARAVWPIDDKHSMRLHLFQKN